SRRRPKTERTFVSAHLTAGRSSLRRRNEMSVTRRIDFNLDGAVRQVHDSTVRTSAMCRIEGDRGETIAVVGFPLVDASVAARGLGGAHQAAVIEILDPRDDAVSMRRELDPSD